MLGPFSAANTVLQTNYEESEGAITPNNSVQA